MFERRRIRKMLEGLTIVPDLDRQLDRYDHAGYYGESETIFVRDCKPLDAGSVVRLLWDMLQASRAVMSNQTYKQLIWVIGTDVSPETTWIDGPTIAED